MYEHNKLLWPVGLLQLDLVLDLHLAVACSQPA